MHRIAHIALVMTALACTAGDEAKPLVDDLSPLSVATEHIVGYWSFDGGSFRDISGNGNDGTPKGAGEPAETVGVSSGAMRFDGGDDEIDIPNIALGTTYSVCAWVNRDNMDDVVSYVAQRESGNAIDITLDGKATTRFIVRDNDGVISTASIGGITAGKWHHVCGVRNGNINSVYLNAVKGTDDTDSKGAITTSSDFEIGGYSGSAGDNMEGIVDEVLIYNKALTASEVQRLYQIGLAKLRSRP